MNYFFSFYLFSGYLSIVFSTKGNRIKFIPEFPGKKKKKIKRKVLLCLFKNKENQILVKQIGPKDLKFTYFMA